MMISTCSFPRDQQYITSDESTPKHLILSQFTDLCPLLLDKSQIQADRAIRLVLEEEEGD